MQRVSKNYQLFRKAELMAKVSLHDQEVDLVLLAIEMTNQAHQVERCWKILGMINEARKTHPNMIDRSLGYYRTVFDSLVLSMKNADGLIPPAFCVGQWVLKKRQ